MPDYYLMPKSKVLFANSAFLLLLRRSLTAIALKKKAKNGKKKTGRSMKK